MTTVNRPAPSPPDGRLGEAFVSMRAELTAAADVERASKMAAYMKDRFPFLGVPAPARRRIAGPVVRAARSSSADDLLALADACWAEPAREFQYVGADALRAGVRHLRPSDLDRVRIYIVTKSWWDTVDSLAAWTVGPLVARHPELTATMDVWIDADDMWLARTAILHQLDYGDDTDADRLFRYCDRRAADNEFFIRKALGWALRQYAKSDPDAVREYVTRRADRLSGLTQREALKHLAADPDR